MWFDSDMGRIQLAKCVMELTSLSPPSLSRSASKLPACVNIPQQGGLLWELRRSKSLPPCLPWFESHSCGYRCAHSSELDSPVSSHVTGLPRTKMKTRGRKTQACILSQPRGFQKESFFSASVSSLHVLPH